MIEESVESRFIIGFTEEQKVIRDTIKDYADHVIRPKVMEFDEAQEFPLAILKELGEMGFMGILIPEQYGGSGLGYVEYALIIEELAKVDPSIALSVAAHNGLCTNHLYLFGNEEQREKYLPDLASGRVIGAWGLTEPFSGSDAAAMKTTAVKEGGTWMVNGSKNFITHGTYADTSVILAITNKEKGKKGISAFIAGRNYDGYSVSKKENKLGMRASDTAQLSFMNLRLPEENLLGNEGEGFIQAMKVLEGGRISIAALSCGLAQGALDASLKYSSERVQFGKSINSFQGIQFKLADMETNINAARLLTYQAAVAKDNGQPIHDIAPKAKLFASEIAEKAASEAVQIFGGYGFTKDYPVEKFYRDVKLLTIGEGTSEVQRIVIARNLAQE